MPQREKQNRLVHSTFLAYKFQTSFNRHSIPARTFRVASLDYLLNVKIPATVSLKGERIHQDGATFQGEGKLYHRTATKAYALSDSKS